MLYTRIAPPHAAAQAPRLAQRVYCTALAMLLVLSEVFSSNLQSTLPGFSAFFRLALTGGAVALLVGKCLFLTDYQSRWQPAAMVLALGIAGALALHGDDRWFILAVLAGIAAKGVDLRSALRTYLAVAVAGLVLVQLLHHLTPLVPFNFYCRNWDYGYGHYNGYGARLFGVFVAWAWLRAPRLRWFDWAGLCALLVYTTLAPGSRGAMGGMVALLVLLALQKLAPRFFAGKLWQALVLALYPIFTAFSLWVGYRFDPTRPELTPVLSPINQLLSGRFEIWHHVFWRVPLVHPTITQPDGSVLFSVLHDNLPPTITLLGGLNPDGDEHHAVDNTYLAMIMNKGVLGAILVAVCVLLLVWRLCRRGCVVESICLCAVLCYLFMENKPFLLAANPLFLLLPVLLTQRGAPLLVLKPPDPAPQ